MAIRLEPMHRFWIGGHCYVFNHTVWVEPTGGECVGFGEGPVWVDVLRSSWQETAG